MVLHARRQLGGLQREVLLRLWRTLSGALLPGPFSGSRTRSRQVSRFRGFLGHGDLTVQCAVLHVNCPACNQRILEDGQDSDVLGSFRECILPKPTANVYGHGEELVISAAEQNQRVCLRFDRVPWLSSFTLLAHAAQFQVSVDGDPHTFRLPDPPDLFHANERTPPPRQQN